VGSEKTLGHCMMPGDENDPWEFRTDRRLSGS
jgi:hypothetical protein